MVSVLELLGGFEPPTSSLPSDKMPSSRYGTRVCGRFCRKKDEVKNALLHVFRPLVSPCGSQCGSGAYLRIHIPNVELCHIVQPETGQTAVRRVAIAAAAVNINDAITMPYTKRLVIDTSQEVDRRVADDADSARVRTSIFWLNASPDARITVGTGAAVNEVELLPTDGNVQMIRQSSQEAQNYVTLVRCPMVEQLPIGGRTAVLSPKLTGTKLIMRAKGGKAHLFVIAQQHGHVGRIHDQPQDVYTHSASVDGVTDDIQMVVFRKLDQRQQSLKLIQFTVDVRYAVDHAVTSRK